MISIIICHNKGNFLEKALESVYASKEVEFEVIVMTTLYMQNEPITHLRQRFPQAKFIHQEGGPDIKRNQGAKHAHGDYLAFFDDDIEMTPHALWEMKRTMDHHKAQMVFGKTKNMEHRDRFDEAGSFLTWSGFLWARAESGVVDTGQFEREEPILAGKSAACMIRKLFFFRVGGFDTTFGILGEETDLAWRVWLLGGQVWWCPRSITYHAFNTKFKPQDFYTNDRVYFNGCRNYITMLLKNLGHQNLWIVPVHGAVWFVAALGMMLTGKWKSGCNILRGLIYVCGHLASILKRRSYIQQTRVLQDKELFPLVLRQPSWSYYLHRFLRYIKIGLHG